MAATDQGILYEGAFGTRELGKDAAMTPDTVVWIASMTNAITATAAMQLVERGQLHLSRRAFAAGALVLAAAPLVARAQAPGKTYRIAIWHRGAGPLVDLGDGGNPAVREFLVALRRLGFEEGRNLIVHRYGNEGRAETYEPTAREIANMWPDVVVPIGSVQVPLLLKYTTTIPIVVAAGADPLAWCFVQSLARPGGNVTGFTIDGGIALNSLRLQLLREAAGNATRLGFLVNRQALIGPAEQVMREAAAGLNVDLVIQVMDGPCDGAGYRQAFAGLANNRVQGLFVSTDAEHLANAKRIVDWVAAARIPAIYPFREFVEMGGLLAYGPDLTDLPRKTAGYVARILHGEKPGDLPIQQPTVFKCIVKLKTANALGLTIPPRLLFQADEVIR